jgi:hypothetical protein
LTPETAAKELEKRRKRSLFYSVQTYHPKQWLLVADIALAAHRNICGLAGRQAGKSHGGVAGQLELARRNAKTNHIYVTSTYSTVEKMAFDPAERMIEEFALEGTVNRARTYVRLKNGSKIYFMGADNAKTIARLRGTPNLKSVIIDECGVYDSDTLKAMIEAVRPGLRPLAGILVLLGTPSLQGKQGTFYEATQNSEYWQHRFDYRDNDKVPSYLYVESLIDQDLRAQGVTRDSAYFKREYLAMFEVDLAEKVYQLSDINLIDTLPTGHELYLTGGDLGVSAEDALVTLGWRSDSQDVFVTEEVAASGQDSLAFASMVQDVWNRLHPIKIAVDPGGLGQKTIKVVQNLYRDIPITEAQKPAIPIQVRAVNNLLRAGKLKILRNSRLAKELATPTWVDGLVGGKIDEHGRHSDLVPALRYACVAYAEYRPEPQQPKKTQQELDAELARAAWKPPEAQYGHSDNLMLSGHPSEAPDSLYQDMSSYGGPRD